MANIEIRNSYSYKYFLTMGDARDNFNGEIDNEKEAKIAATKFCKYNPNGCEEFLKYLEENGYPLSQIKPPRKKPERSEEEKIRMLQHALKDIYNKDEGIQADAARVIEELTDLELSEKAISPLLAIMHNKNKSVWLREIVASALGKIFTSNCPEERVNKLLAFFINAARGSESPIRLVAIKALYAFFSYFNGNSPDLVSQVIKQLLELANNKNKELKRVAITGLTYLILQTKKNEMLDIFRSLWLVIKQEKDEKMLEAASAGLAELVGNSELGYKPKIDLIDELIDLLYKKPYLQAAEFLLKMDWSEITDEGKAKIFASLLKNPTIKNREIEYQRWKALMAFSNVIEKVNERDTSDQVIAKLIAALGSKDNFYRVCAAEIIKRIGQNYENHKPPFFINCSLAMKAKMVQSLLEALPKEKNKEARDNIIEALSGFASNYTGDLPQSIRNDMVNPLIAALRYNSSTIKINAARALNKLARTDIKPEIKERMIFPLVNARRDRNKKVRIEVIETLGTLVDIDISNKIKAQLVYPLVNSLDDREIDVEIAVASVLSKLSEMKLAWKAYRQKGTMKRSGIYFLDFQEGSEVWKLYKALKFTLKVKDSEFDRGYYYLNLANHQRKRIHGKDYVIQKLEVLEYALSGYHYLPTEIKDMIKQYLGDNIPWALDEGNPQTTFDQEIRDKANQAITSYKKELENSGLDPKKDEYQIKLANFVYSFAMAPAGAPPKPIIIPQILTPPSKIPLPPSWRNQSNQSDQFTMINAGIDLFLVAQHSPTGGLGLINFKQDCALEASALEALRQGCGHCTEQSKILFALFELAGLIPMYFVGELKDNTHHASIALTLSHGKIRIFDPGLKVANGDLISYYQKFDWLELQSNREFLSYHYYNLGSDYLQQESDKAKETAKELFKKAQELNPIE